MGNTLKFKNVPKRIISLVPSLTHLLDYLELDESVIGITRYCVHPENWLKTKQKIGGTKDIKIDVIRSLKPDLILANKEENTKDIIEQLQKDFNVYVSDVNDVVETCDMIKTVGEITNTETKANELV